MVVLDSCRLTVLLSGPFSFSGSLLHTFGILWYVVVSFGKLWLIVLCRVPLFSGQPLEIRRIFHECEAQIEKSVSLDHCLHHSIDSFSCTPFVLQRLILT